MPLAGGDRNISIWKSTLITELEMKNTDAENLKINKLFRMGDFNPQRKYTRPLCGQFYDKTHEDLVMSRF